MKIRLFTTGGTFDKEYDELTGKLFFKDTHVKEILGLGRCRVDVEVRTLMMVDSLEMTITDRETIARSCSSSDEDRIMVTHGTDTMIETARFVADQVKKKTIVFTGAMIPYRFGSSDGLFNLACALAFVQVLPAGVYVAMNGRCFAWNRVCKNKKTGFFEELEDEPPTSTLNQPRI